MSTRWIPVEDYAAEAGMPPCELVSAIIDGNLPGERQGDRWYVAAPLVELVPPGGLDDNIAFLKISACRMGCYVTAGRGDLEIPLRFDDPGRLAALTALDSAMSSGVPPETPLAISLNGERFTFDSSLWVDIGAALVEYASLFDASTEEPP